MSNEDIRDAINAFESGEDDDLDLLQKLKGLPREMLPANAGNFEEEDDEEWF